MSERFVISFKKFRNIASSSRVIKVERFVKQPKKNGTKTVRSRIKSIQIDRICDDLRWTSDPKQSLNIFLGKHLSESL